MPGRKPDNTKCILFKPRRPPRVMQPLRRLAMLAAIDLNHQPSRQADKIAEIGTERELAAEAKAIDLF